MVSYRLVASSRDNPYDLNSIEYGEPNYPQRKKVHFDENSELGENEGDKARN